jgi:hypothetical protein
MGDVQGVPAGAVRLKTPDERVSGVIAGSDDDGGDLYGVWGEGDSGGLGGEEALSFVAEGSYF